MKSFQTLLIACFAMALLFSATPASAGIATPDPEIEALIVRVGQSDDVVFIRNGSEHSASEAATHMHRKLRAVHGRVHTAEQFIDHIGTRSSFSGRKYRVRLPDGRELDSATWLYSLLRDLRAQHGKATPQPSG